MGAFAAAVIAVAAVLVVALVGGSDEERAAPPRATTPTATPAESTPEPTATAEPEEERPRGELAIGITEPNPAFVSTGATHEPFERWRGELARLAPRYYRLVVDWSVVQPRRSGRPRLGVPIGGCLRDVGPCASWGGVVGQLRALASRQREQPGRWQVLVVMTGTPRWAARGRSACDTDETLPRSRAPRPDALDGYRAVVSAILAAAEAEGAELRYWSPWNEPNHPYFLFPQRRDCTGSSPSAAVAPYAELARALAGALEVAPGEQEVVLGELAGLWEPGSDRSTSIREFIRALPRDVVCAARVWGQHGYVGGRDPVDDVARGLRAFACDREHEIWITETGVGGPQSGQERPQSRSALLESCRRMHARLERWYRDRRVSAAFQYTFREDDLFPVGLVTTRLDRAYPTLELWQRWGERERPTAPPPERSGCA